MQRDRALLADIVEAAGHLADFLRDADLAGFRNSELLRSAVVQKLSVIGEAAARVSPELRERHPEIPWSQLVAFRNILVHHYFNLDWEIIWRTATVRCRILRDQAKSALAELDDATG